MLRFLVPPAIDGEWTDWSNWSPCSPCGHSVKTRTRTCTDPAPAFGGSQCTGPSSMTQLCPTNNCKGKFCLMFITLSVKNVIENIILWNQFSLCVYVEQKRRVHSKIFSFTFLVCSSLTVSFPPSLKHRNSICLDYYLLNYFLSHSSVKYI